MQNTNTERERIKKLLWGAPRDQVHKYPCGCFSLHQAGDKLPAADAPCPRCAPIETH